MMPLNAWREARHSVTMAPGHSIHGATMGTKKVYVGIDKDKAGGMTPTGNIVRDAWVFGLIPESETCEGWTVQGIESLYDKVSAAWGPFGHLASNLPSELRERHQRIYDAAVARARELGWDPELDDEN